MSELNLGLKISSVKINININVDRSAESDKKIKLLKEEQRLEAFSKAKECAVINYHFANGYF